MVISGLLWTVLIEFVLWVKGMKIHIFGNVNGDPAKLTGELLMQMLRDAKDILGQPCQILLTAAWGGTAVEWFPTGVDVCAKDVKPLQGIVL